MKRNVANTRKVQQTERVENMQPSAEDVAHGSEESLPDDFFVQIANEIEEYTKKTDIPILGEFCAKNGYFEHLMSIMREKSSIVKFQLILLETKQKAALERMIYSGELNATIGAHLLKTWQDKKVEGLEKSLGEALQKTAVTEPWWLLDKEDAEKYNELSRKIKRLKDVGQESALL